MNLRAFNNYILEIINGIDAAENHHDEKSNKMFFNNGRWALNTLDVREAVTSICGTLAGADMNDGLRINGIRNGRQYVLTPNFNAGGAAFNAGKKSESAADREERLWIEAVRNDTDPLTSAEQAYVVTRILEGIYESSKTGEIYRF